MVSGKFVCLFATCKKDLPFHSKSVAIFSQLTIKVTELQPTLEMVQQRGVVQVGM